MRFGFALASWMVAAWFAEGALGADIGSEGRRLEERIEMQLKGGRPPPPAQQRERSHEDSIQPWELVSV